MDVLKNFKTKKMINTKILLKALGTLFMPTLAILFITFMGFFNLQEFINFMTGQSAGAVALRLISVLLEIIFCVIMYIKFYKEELIKDPTNNLKNYDTRDRSASLNSILPGEYNDSYRVYSTEIDNIKIIEKIIKI